MRVAPITLLAALLLAPLAQAADVAAGKQKAAELCAACHQPDGNSTNPQYPVLAGQHADFLRKALKDYQTGTRNNAIMAGLAKPLTKADIANLSAWFASQKSSLSQKP